MFVIILICIVTAMQWFISFLSIFDRDFKTKKAFYISLIPIFYPIYRLFRAIRTAVKEIRELE